MNLNDLLKQFNLGDLQKQMQQVQENMKHITVTGSSGGGMVQISMNGIMEITDVTIDPMVLKEQDISMLQDLVRASLNSLMSNYRDRVKQESAGFPFPGGLGQQ